MTFTQTDVPRRHIAFLTPEFVTDHADGGGLGNYLHRMGAALVERGHAVDVFVSSYGAPAELVYAGMTVHRVRPAPQSLGMRGFGMMCRSSGILSAPFRLWVQARNLARALERRHAVRPFDVVQSADFLAVGLAVPRRRGRTHLVRCSSAADLYNEIDGRRSRDERWRERLERLTMSRADGAYAPSNFLAEHLQQKHRIHLTVLRPPVLLEVSPAPKAIPGLPPRYLVHFGQLTRRKGTFWFLEALQRALAQDASIHAVFVGRGDYDELAPLLAALGSNRNRVVMLYPLPKPQLYSVVQQAEAAVLPSLVDNLPNTVIESLLLGVPVIAGRGGSVDELVENGVTGELVAPGDVSGLAEALLRVWRDQSPARKGFVWQRGVVGEMSPEHAVAGFLRLADDNRQADG